MVSSDSLRDLIQGLGLYRVNIGFIRFRQQEMTGGFDSNQLLTLFSTCSTVTPAIGVPI